MSAPPRRSWDVGVKAHLGSTGGTPRRPSRGTGGVAGPRRWAGGPARRRGRSRPGTAGTCLGRRWRRGRRIGWRRRSSGLRVDGGKRSSTSSGRADRKSEAWVPYLRQLHPCQREEVERRCFGLPAYAVAATPLMSFSCAGSSPDCAHFSTSAVAKHGMAVPRALHVS